jgi:hypothetical protein
MPTSPRDNPPCPPGIDERVWAAMQASNRFEEQDEDGVDVSLILQALKLTPAQCIGQGNAMAVEHHWIRQHARRIA